MTVPADWIVPEWPTPASVKSLVTTRLGGVSEPPFDSMNLATHVGDDPSAVAQNRSLLAAQLAIPEQNFCWLKQVHGVTIVEAQEGVQDVEADAVTSVRKKQVCVVMTADCLPVLLCDRQGSRVAALHGGWRGLADGIIEKGLAAFDDASQVLAWLGPAIGPESFEVGEDVLEAFAKAEVDVSKAFVKNAGAGKWLADIYAIAGLQLRALGVSGVFGGGFCTMRDSRFYSYRRDGQRSGRMASMIWLT